jgi:hypothetical protein
VVEVDLLAIKVQLIRIGMAAMAMVVQVVAVTTSSPVEMALKMQVASAPH